MTPVPPRPFLSDGTVSSCDMCVYMGGGGGGYMCVLQEKREGSLSGFLNVLPRWLPVLGLCVDKCDESPAVQWPGGSW